MHCSQLVNKSRYRSCSKIPSDGFGWHEFHFDGLGKCKGAIPLNSGIALCLCICCKVASGLQAKQKQHRQSGKIPMSCAYSKLRRPCRTTFIACLSRNSSFSQGTGQHRNVKFVDLVLRLVWGDALIEILMTFDAFGGGGSMVGHGFRQPVTRSRQIDGIWT